MNYCSIQDAWGQENYISKQYKNFDQNIQKTHEVEKPIIQKKYIEKFSKVKLSKPSLKPNKQGYCNEFVNHLKTCRSCQLKMREQFRPKILENFEDIIQTNRDIIVLILVGICFMLFFNLLTSATTSQNTQNTQK